VHESVDVPLPPVIVVGLTMHERLVELGETVKVTVAENPFTGATVNAEVPAEPASSVTAIGLALTVKSWTVYVVVRE
jgi:hypothetical protein